MQLMHYKQQLTCSGSVLFAGHGQLSNSVAMSSQVAANGSRGVAGSFRRLRESERPMVLGTTPYFKVILLLFHNPV